MFLYIERFFIIRSPHIEIVIYFMLNRILILSFLIWVGIHGIKAQQTFYKSYEIQDGLPTNIVYDIALDTSGYLYLSTDYGMYKYNGISFKEIAVAKTHASTFTDLHVDYHNRLWGRSFSNDIYVHEKDSFAIVSNAIGLKKNLSINRVYYRDSFIYVNDNLDIYRYHIDYKTLFLANKENRNKERKIWDYIVDNQGNIIVKTKTNFLAYNKAGEERELYINNPILSHLEGKFSIVENTYGHNVFYVPFRQDSFSVYTWNGVEDTLQNLFTVANPATSKIIRAFQLDERFVWCVTTAGLYTYDLEKGVLQLILPQNIYCSKVMRSYDGGYWISTIGNGLIYIPSLEITFHSSLPYNANFITLNSLNDSNVIIGTNRGTILHIDHKCQLVNKYHTPFQDEIQFVYYDSLKSRIYHTQGYHNIGDSVLRNKLNLSKVAKHLDDNHLIVGAWNGAHIIHKDFGQKQSFLMNDSISNQSNYTDAKTLRENRVRCISYDKNNQILAVGFIDNLVIFDLKNQGKADTILYNQNSIFATSLIERNDTLWIGTFASGVMALDKKTKSILGTYTIANNLPSNNCKRVVLDNDNLWILTFKGLAKLDLKQLDIPAANLNYQYALRNIFITDMVVQKDHIWLTSTKGLLKINKNYFDRQSIPKVFLHQIKLRGEILPLTDTLILDPSPKDLNISFDIVAYFSDKDLSYEYRILGMDTLWHQLEENQSVLTFPNLHAGAYTLSLRIHHNSPLFDKRPVPELYIVVLPNFWEQAWFYILLVIILLVFIIGLVFYIVRRYLYFFTQKQTMREKLISHELSALRARMNPHFLYNVLSSIQALIYINRKDDAIQVLGNFSQLMRIILDISGKDFISLEEEINTLELYTSLEKIRFDKQDEFIVEFKIDEKLDLQNTLIPTLVIQPIVENAIKHGLMHKKGTKVLEIIFQKSVHNNLPYLIIIVSDNGIGRLASNEINKKRENKQKHNSFATQAISQRIQLINQNRPNTPLHMEVKDTFRDNVSIGTTVKIFIPLIESLSKQDKIKTATTQIFAL